MVTEAVQAVREPESGRAKTSGPAPFLLKLRAVVAALGERGIPYCSWKSNEHLSAALQGETDLDLLVDGSRADDLREILARHSLKALVAPPAKSHRATEHFLGFDERSGRQFHLHVQYELILGEKHVKNYRLPIERHFLSATRTLDGVTAPCPEVELAVLTVRALLKYRARDVVKDTFGIRSPGVPDEIARELRWLTSQTNREAVQQAVERFSDVVPSGPVCEFLDRYQGAARSGVAFFRLRARMRRALRPCRRRSVVVARLQYFRATWRMRRRLRLRRGLYDGRFTSAAGGAGIALVGADGSGKSTICDELERWLGWKLQTRRYYLGSKEPSRRSRVLYLGFRVMRRAHRAIRSGDDAPSRWTRPIASTRDTVLALHHLSIARDRLRRMRRARRDVHRGRVVLFDRFPLEMLSSDREHRLLDGPRIASALNLNGSRMTRWLATVEERLYARFGLPDHLILLQVDPEVALERKPDHEPAVVASKSKATLALAEIAGAHGVEPTCVDANRPLDEVLQDVKTAVWNVL